MNNSFSVSDDSAHFDQWCFLEAVQEGLSNIAAGDVFSTDELRNELGLIHDNWKHSGDCLC